MQYTFTKTGGGLIIGDSNQSLPVSGGGNNSEITEAKKKKEKNIVPLGLVFVDKPKKGFIENKPIEVMDDDAWQELYDKVKPNNSELFLPAPNNDNEIVDNEVKKNKLSPHKPKKTIKTKKEHKKITKKHISK